MNEIYKEDKKLFQSHFLEQYKLYVEMTDRISARRNTANVFFLSLNTTIIAGIGLSLEKIETLRPSWLIVFPLIGILIFCLVWWWLIRSYRNINSAKYKVIGKMESSLPFSPYYKEEWKELGEGKDIRKYLPLTAIEQWIPIVFGTMYLILGFTIVALF